MEAWKTSELIACNHKRNSCGAPSVAIEGKAEALIMVLTARGIVLDDVTRMRILGERDAHQLDRWIARATTCEILADRDGGAIV